MFSLKHRFPPRRTDTAGVRPLSLRSYLLPLVIALLYAAGCIGAFFAFVDRQTKVEVSKDLTANLSQQVQHLASMLDQQFSQLEGLAAYLGDGDTLWTPNVIELLARQREHTDIVRLCIADAQGSAVYDDGSAGVVVDRDYFRGAMAGQRVLSDPLESRVDDTLRVVLAVPIPARDGGARGMLGGSYDIGSLNNMLFEGVYGSDGYALIVTADGLVIASDGDAGLTQATPGINLFEYYYSLTGRNTLSDLISADFASQTAGVHLVPVVNRSRYIAYQPLGFNDWMICYAVDRTRATLGYRFLLDYEIMLCAALLGGLFVLLIALFLISHRRQHALLHKARVDGLTGTLNKESATAAIRARLAQPGEHQHLLVMIDVDRFKSINDTYGHAAGDEVLRRFGATLQKYFRESDIVGRMGGDEFIVLMCDVAAYDHALERLNALTQRLARLEVPGMPENAVSCSVGISRFPQHGTDFEELFACADIAMYRSKRRRSNAITLYTDDMSHQPPETARPA